MLDQQSLMLIFCGLGSLLLLAFGSIIFFEVRKRRAPKPSPDAPPPTPRNVNLKQLEALPTSEAFERMHKEIRSWGISLLILGGLSVLASGFLNAQWGLVLVIVGVMSFFFKDASMFAVYAVVLAWAGINNLLSATGTWALFALFQFWLTFTTFQRFFIYRRVERESLNPPPSEDVPPDPFAVPAPSAEMPMTRSHRVFPILGALTGIGGALGTFGMFGASFAAGMMGTDSLLPTAIMNVIAGFALSLSIFGFALSLAGLLSRYKPMFATILGTVVSGLSLITWIGLSILSLFGS